MKHFHCELKDISPTDAWMNVEVYYEYDKIYEIEDENGKAWKLSDLSEFDHAKVIESLIHELSARNI